MKTMKHLSKRGFALFIALLMCVSVLPMQALAANGTVSVTYHANTGSEAEDAEVRNLPKTQTGTMQNQLDGGASFVIPEEKPLRVGYDFVGWFMDGKYKDKGLSGTQIFYQSVDLYAKWEAKYFTVTYFNGTQKLGEQKVRANGFANYGEGIHVADVKPSVKAPVREGYKFAGWSTRANDPQVKLTEDGVLKGIGCDTKLYAVWEELPAETITLTYDANPGGENIDVPASQTKEVKGKDKEGKPYANFQISKEVLVREGYKFLGWSTDEKAVEAKFLAGGPISIGCSTTLYAVWEKLPAETITLTYDANAGGENIVVPAPETKEVAGNDAEGKPYAKFQISKEEPVRKGYKFLGWSTDENAAEAKFLAGGPISIGCSTTLYAVWKEVCFTITYDANAGGDEVSNMPEEDKVRANGFTADGFHKADYEVSDKEPARNGYTFLGWTTTKDAEVKPLEGGKLTIGCNTTLYAVWQQDEAATDPDEGDTELDPTESPEPTATPEPSANPDEGNTEPTVSPEPSIGPDEGDAADPGESPEPAPNPGGSTPAPTTPGNPGGNGGGNGGGSTPAGPAATPAPTYTVNWEDGDGNVIGTSTTTDPNNPGTPPVDPEKEGSSFLGWGEPDIVGNVITIIAEWDEEIDPGDVPLAVAPGLNSTDHFAYIIGYGDGTVRPGRNITRAEVATIFYRLMTDDYRGTFWSQDNDFTDVNPGDWFNNAVSTSAEAELIKGYADGTFQGKKNITRAEFATIAARFLSDDPTGENPFTDIEGHWGKNDILKAYEAGWINGYADGSFKPNALITRAEAMTIVNRMLNRVPHAEDMLDEDEMVKWVDNNPGAWYYAAVQEATNSHDYEMGGRDGQSVEKWTAMKANRDWAALEKEWSNAYSGSDGNDVM